MLKRYLLFFIMLISVTGYSQKNCTLSIEFEGLKTEKGKLFVALYNSEKDFLKNQMKGSIVDITNGKASAIFDNLEKGIYAISSFYDKNDNGKMDTNFLGIPKEPVALSNNAKGKFGPPKYRDAKFNISESKTQLKIKFN